MKKLLTVLALVGLMAASSLWAETASNTGAIPQRDDIDDKYKWKTEDIYPTLEAWEDDYNELSERIPGLGAYKGQLGNGAAQLLGCMALSDSLDVIIGNLYVYAYLRLDEDNRQGQFQELGGRAAVINSQLGTAQSFIAPELIAIGKDKIDAFMTEEPQLETYRHFFDDLFRQQEHVLSEKEEALLALGGNVLASPARTFNMVETADLKLGTVEDSEGNPVDLTWGRYRQIMRKPDRELRSRANDTVQASYKRYVNTLASTLGGSLQRDWFLAQARGYNSCLEHSLDNDNIPVEVFHSLVEAVNANLEPLHQLTALRKKVLGYDTLWTYDLSVPLASESDRVIPYDEGVRMNLEGLKPLGSEYLSVYEEGINSGWIDVYETEAKGTGAYSWGTYTSHPYILLNYADRLTDVFTLAHEMGHAMNSYYTNRYEPYVYHGHSLFTAEVASTFNEALMMKYMLAHAQTKEEKLALLEYYIEQIDGTFFTQVMFSEFELAIHEHVQNGGATSVDFFRQTYREIMQKYYGPDLAIGPDNDMSGMKIGHFYRQYYVYQYATCYAAAQALSQKVMNSEPGALERYMDFLATGTSKYPVEILQDAGVDMMTPDPVEATIDLFGELVDEYERLLLEG